MVRRVCTAPDSLRQSRNLGSQSLGDVQTRRGEVPQLPFVEAHLGHGDPALLEDLEQGPVPGGGEANLTDSGTVLGDEDQARPLASGTVTHVRIIT
jgi:hypothetical protein